MHQRILAFRPILDQDLEIPASLRYSDCSRALRPFLVLGNPYAIAFGVLDGDEEFTAETGLAPVMSRPG